MLVSLGLPEVVEKPIPLAGKLEHFSLSGEVFIVGRACGHHQAQGRGAL